MVGLLKDNLYGWNESATQNIINLKLSTPKGLQCLYLKIENLGL